jgi:hypothetical protein
MSSSTAAAGTTISQTPTTRVPDRAPVRHEPHRTADLGRPRGRRSWADFAEDQSSRPSAP